MSLKYETRNSTYVMRKGRIHEEEKPEPLQDHPVILYDAKEGVFVSRIEPNTTEGEGEG